MKSLSFLVVLGTLFAIIFGAVFATQPAVAGGMAHFAHRLAVKASAPVTGVPAETALASAASESEAPTLQLNITKDASSQLPVQEAASPAVVAAEAPATAAAALQSFVNSVSSGNASQVTGIYVEGVMAYGVVGQGGNAAYVSEKAGVVTQFAMASQFGSQGFLAHNYLAGGAFSSIAAGNVITLVYGDGSVKQFQVTSIQRYQALSPNSTQSTFVDLESGDTLSATSLFYRIYNRENPVVLQTCIAKDGLSTWGRLFITAVPLG